MGSIWAQAVVHACSSLAIAVGGEVVGVPPGHDVVAFEVGVRNHVVKVALEEGDLQQPSTIVARDCAPGLLGPPKINAATNSPF